MHVRFGALFQRRRGEEGGGGEGGRRHLWNTSPNLVGDNALHGALLKGCSPWRCWQSSPEEGGGVAREILHIADMIGPRSVTKAASATARWSKWRRSDDSEWVCLPPAFAAPRAQRIMARQEARPKAAGRKRCAGHKKGMPLVGRGIKFAKAAGRTACLQKDLNATNKVFRRLSGCF